PSASRRAPSSAGRCWFPWALLLASHVDRGPLDRRPRRSPAGERVAGGLAERANAALERVRRGGADRQPQRRRSPSIGMEQRARRVDDAAPLRVRQQGERVERLRERDPDGETALGTRERRSARQVALEGSGGAGVTDRKL